MPRPDYTLNTHQPKMRELGTMYRVAHYVDGRRYSDTCWAQILVDSETNLATIKDWYWFGVSSANRPTGGSLKQSTARQDLIQWLRDWNIIELRRIGSEDYEFFATDNLTGGTLDVVV